MGVEVVDITSEFRGITVGRAKFILGCVQWLVQPRVNDKGEKPAPSWIDEGELRVVEGGQDLKAVEVELTATPVAQ